MNKYEYKKLTPFKWFVIENFPFIEADFDALTEWQLFCKLGKEINKIIDSQNLVGQEMENVTNAFIDLQNDYIEKFNNLQEYVNNYFNNLDVQDEIDNKLNEMAESGQLQEIFEQFYIQDYKKIDSLSLTDKFLYLFGNDLAYWKMAGQRTANFEYKVGDFIKDKNSNNIYVCSVAGTTGNTYPTFTGEHVADGTVIWDFVSIPTDWEENKHYFINNSINIKNLSYVCIYEHTSTNADGYNIKIKNNILYKRVNNNTLSNYPELLFTIGYDNLNKVNDEGMNVPKSAIQVSNDGELFNIVDTPMQFAGQDFSPFFYNGKYYILTFTKQMYNDFGLFITQNFKDYIKTEIDLNISNETRPHVWFGQWFKDTLTNKLYILYTASDLENPTIEYQGQEFPNLRLWKVEVTDIENLTFGTPTPINLSDNSRFDVFISIRNNTYYLFTRRYVDANDRTHEGHVEIWTSTDLENWTLNTSRIQALNNSGYEAMSVVEINPNKYYMYVSKNLYYDYNRVWRIESKDLINWTNLIPVKPSTLNLDEFGTVIKIENQDALSYLYNYINTNNNSRNTLRPTNYINLISDKNNVYRNLNYNTHTLNVLSAEDVIYKTNVNNTDIEINNIVSNYELPHRFFIRTTNVGNDYIKITNQGNIYLPDNISEAYIQNDIILEFVYSADLEKYVLVSPSKEYLLTSIPRNIILNDLATDGVIENLQLENNCIYTVRINTVLTINNFSFKNNQKGKFNIAFLIEGNGSTHYTKLTINGNSNVLISQYGTSSSLELTSANNSNKFIPFGRYFGTGALHLQNL
jgi:hypothetical protein